MAWVALESGNVNLNKYFRMQCIKKSSTLRISTKGKKPIPKIVYKYGDQNGMVKEYLANRSFILSSLKRLKHEEVI